MRRHLSAIGMEARLMTMTQKQQIAAMRRSGISYGKIATDLGASEGTVKSFCRRNKLGALSESFDGACAFCGKPLTHTAKAKKKRFCSDKCRLSWWNAHPEAVNRKAVYCFTCASCGTAFESYGDKNRKYCSRACYGLARSAH